MVHKSNKYVCSPVTKSDRAFSNERATAGSDSPFVDVPLIAGATPPHRLLIKGKVSAKWKAAAKVLGSIAVLALAGDLLLGGAIVNKVYGPFVSFLKNQDEPKASFSLAGKKNATIMPQDCEDVKANKEGKQRLVIGSDSYEVWCSGDGWTVIQSRGQFGNPEEYFYRGWAEYVAGFGVPGKEFWLGLDALHALTDARRYKLRVKVQDVDRERREYNYGWFRVMVNAMLQPTALC